MQADGDARDQLCDRGLCLGPCVLRRGAESQHSAPAGLPWVENGWGSQRGPAPLAGRVHPTGRCRAHPNRPFQSMGSVRTTSRPPSPPATPCLAPTDPVAPQGVVLMTSQTPFGLIQSQQVPSCPSLPLAPVHPQSQTQGSSPLPSYDPKASGKLPQGGGGGHGGTPRGGGRGGKGAALTGGGGGLPGKGARLFSSRQ